MNQGVDPHTASDDKSDQFKKGRRFMLKLSGEAFSGGGGLGVDPDVVHAIAREIAAVVRDGAEIAVVIGGGNFFRGAELQQRGMDGPGPTTWACSVRS